MFSWFGNSAYTTGGVNWSATNSSGSYSGSTPGFTGEVGRTSGPSNLSSYMDLAAAATNIFSGISKYQQYNDRAAAYATSASAVWEEYRINDLAMRRSAVKQFGALQNRTGEGGSAMDLLQESAINFALDSWRLKFNAQQKYNYLRKMEKAAKKSGAASLGGSIGSAVGMVAGVGIGLATGGLGLAALAGAGALGGMVGQGLGSTAGYMM